MCILLCTLCLSKSSAALRVKRYYTMLFWWFVDNVVPLLPLLKKTSKINFYMKDKLLSLFALLLTMTQGASAWSGSGNSASDPILIANANDWNTLATNVASGTNYSGKYFKLTADITVTTMVTATFSGTFDGGGHTLTFNYTATGDNAAPFAYITGATIKNLRVAGTINTGYKFAAGIAAECGTTTITNCQSSVTINSSVDGDGTHGGLIGHQSSGTLTINSCLFDGELMGAKTTGCGGFVGWVANSSGYHTYISNSLFAPANITVKAPTFCRHNSSTLHLEASTCYYITPNWTASTVQGTNAGSMTTASLVTALNNGGTNWCNNGGNATPILIFDYIGNQSNWNAFTSGINAGINYSGKTVKMSADFTATTMVTATFSGTFDGGGHTLTFNYTATDEKVAPFRYITGATIKNLRVAGTINAGGYKFAAGIVSISNGGTITNCGTLNITNCLFDGKLLGTTTTSCGGIVGWHNSNSTLNISNSLFAPAEVTVQGGAIIARDDANSLSNCYYISDWAAATVPATVQGTNANSMTAAALVAALNNGTKNWCIYRGNAIPVMVNLVINNKTEWDNFSSHAGNYENKYVQLNADISNITAMTSGTFQGIFDGNGHTLTVNLSASSYTAPFSLLNDGTIMNLHVEGSVTVTGDYGGGLVCRTSGGDNLIDNCVVNTNVNGVSYIGGVIAHAYNAKKLTISNCVYGGTLTQSGGYIGGIFGWYNNKNNTNLNLIMHNCLFKGTYDGNGQFHPIGVKKVAATFSNLDCRDCFYTANPTTPDDPGRFFTDGTKVYSIIAGTDVTISGLGTTTSTYEHNVITVYSHGIKYNINSTDYYYAGGDEVVSLNLAHGSKTGYTFSNYEVSGGGSLSNLTATSATLTMTAADQTIDAQWTENTATLTDGDDLSALSAWAGKTCTVTYTRSFTAGKPSTVCLPFAYTPKGEEKFYSFTDINEDGGNYTADMTEVVSPLVANTPYLFMPTGNANFSGTYAIPASITAGTTTSGDWKFVGTYTTQTWDVAPTGIYGFSAKATGGISQGEFVKVGAYVRVKPMRCYLKYKDGTADYSAARSFSDVPSTLSEPLPEKITVRFIDANGEVTGIGSLNTQTGEVSFDSEAWYTLDGKRLNAKPNTKGIYVNNGKKVVVK